MAAPDGAVKGSASAAGSTGAAAGSGRSVKGAAPVVKCLVWDLDDTLWGGTVLEGDDVRPVEAALRTLHALDVRGILHAVASRGDHATATARLERLGLAEMFTAVEIGWGAKSASVRRVSESLGIGIDTLAFVDNDPVERAEVAAAHPTVRCYGAERIPDLPDLAEFQPSYVTDESRARRELYRAEARRQQAREVHEGAPAEFLASLGLELTVRQATEDDLARAHELTVRTHQLNTTGRTYGMDELRALCDSPHHQVLVAQLTDVYGSYGTVGLALTERGGGRCVLRLLLLSCRVMSRGIGPALIGHIVHRALAEGLRPVAEFVPTDVNRVMLVNLRFAGFETLAEEAQDSGILLGFPADHDPPPLPAHVRVVTADSTATRRTS
ncbi:HAD family hydrolase [Streptomyces sp. NL15-2K]|uniref:HAD-IIIC family phosphatase n=1 Tax=Streptomyces sp. NL15-2K TaxID=376149 RepID=UPI000F55BE61|nr:MULTISPECIES: HAD-IIIC family phosphatase [Actinomycetes]WKX14150.1 HAD-IIIC family phosphatase [Kutzneria buriramensis]